ncbi:MAG: hypothetical protein WCA35_13815 [Kovacikia sp.]
MAVATLYLTAQGVAVVESGKHRGLPPLVWGATATFALAGTA